MNPLHYIGDPISAAGWRLAGASVQVPAAGDETLALQDALARAPLVVLSAAVAARIDGALLSEATAALAPLVVVVPDPQGQLVLPDFAARLRTQLGLEA